MTHPVTPSGIAAQLADEYAASTLARMAAARGVTYQAMQKKLKRLGIPRRPRGRPRKAVAIPTDSGPQN